MMRSRICLTLAASAAVAVVFTSARAASASSTPIYSFETLYNNSGVIDPAGTRPDDFHFNGGGTTISQSTSGATLGTHSMNFQQDPTATFTGAQTELLPSTLTAANTYGISLDLTVPSTGNFSGNFARMAVSLFGSENDSPDPQNPVIDQVQCASFAEQNISLDAGRTYRLTLPLIAIFDPRTFDLFVPTSTIFRPGADRLTLTSWELFINKSSDSALSVFIDNVQAVNSPVAVWNSDASGDWTDNTKWNSQPVAGNNTNVVPSGADTTVLFNGIFAADARAVTLTSAQTVGRIEFNGAGTYTIGGSSTLTMDVTSGQATIDDHRGVHVISAPLVLNDNTSIEVASVNGQIAITNLQTTTSSITKSGGGILLASNVRAGGLAVNEGIVRIPANGTSASTSRVGTLSFAGGATPTATLDLKDNDLIVTSGTYAAVTSAIAFARHGGLWDRPGLTSSSAATATPKNKTLGTITGAEFHTAQGAAATFDGFAVANSDLLVKYTYYGDADLNGQVNFDDYSRIDAGFNNARTGWFNGDFDYSGGVDFDDYSLIDNAFNTQSGTLRRAMSYLDGGDRSDQGMNTPALQLVMDHFAQFGQPYANGFLNAVPEPTSALALIGIAAAIKRRRRN